MFSICKIPTHQTNFLINLRLQNLTSSYDRLRKLNNTITRFRLFGCVGNDKRVRAREIGTHSSYMRLAQFLDPIGCRRFPSVLRNPPRLIRGLARHVTTCKRSWTGQLENSFRGFVVQSGFLHIPFILHVDDSCGSSREFLYPFRRQSFPSSPRDDGYSGF